MSPEQLRIPNLLLQRRRSMTTFVRDVIRNGYYDLGLEVHSMDAIVFLNADILNRLKQDKEFAWKLFDLFWKGYAMNVQNKLTISYEFSRQGAGESVVECLDNQLMNFTKMHDEFIENWNLAMKTGDTSALERMAEHYYVAFFMGAKEKPAFYNRDEAVNGMRLSVNELLGAEKKFENRVIRLKDMNLAVVFYELLIEKDTKILARLFTIENWQLIDGQWLLVREIEEQVN